MHRRSYNPNEIRDQYNPIAETTQRLNDQMSSLRLAIEQEKASENADQALLVQMRDQYHDLERNVIQNLELYNKLISDEFINDFINKPHLLYEGLLQRLRQYLDRDLEGAVELKIRLKYLIEYFVKVYPDNASEHDAIKYNRDKLFYLTGLIAITRDSHSVLSDDLKEVVGEKHIEYELAKDKYNELVTRNNHYKIIANDFYFYSKAFSNLRTKFQHRNDLLSVSGNDFLQKISAAVIDKSIDYQTAERLITYVADVDMGVNSANPALNIAKINLPAGNGQRSIPRIVIGVLIAVLGAAMITMGVLGLVGTVGMSLPLSIALVAAGVAVMGVGIGLAASGRKQGLQASLDSYYSSASRMFNERRISEEQTGSLDFVLVSSK